MTKTKLLRDLRALDTRLHSTEMQNFFSTKTEPTRARFVSLRNEVSQQVSKLTNAELEDIANKLSELSADIESGIENLQAKLDALNNTVAILNTISTVVGLVGRVLAFTA